MKPCTEQSTTACTIAPISSVVIHDGVSGIDLPWSVPPVQVVKCLGFTMDGVIPHLLSCWLWQRPAHGCWLAGRSFWMMTAADCSPVGCHIPLLTNHKAEKAGLEWRIISLTVQTNTVGYLAKASVEKETAVKWRRILSNWKGKLSSVAIADDYRLGHTAETRIRQLGFDGKGKVGGDLFMPHGLWFL